MRHKKTDPEPTPLSHYIESLPDDIDDAHPQAARILNQFIRGISEVGQCLHDFKIEDAKRAAAILRAHAPGAKTAYRKRQILPVAFLSVMTFLQTLVITSHQWEWGFFDVLSILCILMWAYFLVRNIYEWKRYGAGSAQTYVHSKHWERAVESARMVLEEPPPTAGVVMTRLSDDEPELREQTDRMLHFIKHEVIDELTYQLTTECGREYFAHASQIHNTPAGA